MVSSSSSSKSGDRVLGLITTISLGILIYVSANSIKRIIDKFDINSNFNKKKQLNKVWIKF